MSSRSRLMSGGDEVRITRASRHLTHRPATTPVEDVAAIVRRDDTVVIGHGSGWPRALVESLVAGATTPFRIVHNRIDDDLPYFTDHARRLVSHVGLMVARQTRAHVASGLAEFVPNSYSTTTTLFGDGAIACDVVVVHVTPPDGDGWCSLGTCVAYLPAAMERARAVIAQVNPQMPRTVGTSVHVSAFDHIVEVDEPLHTAPPPPGDDVTDAIAANVAAMVRDADIIQVGIGKLGDAVLAALAGKSGLRMWTETFSDAAITLLRSGAVTPGPDGEPAITATFVTGSGDLYRSIDGESAIRMLAVDRVNHPGRLAALTDLVAINSAIEVDLGGQVNAESIGATTYSGSGGHLDFAIGAAHSPGGRYICALPSTARNGKSRIVAQLSPGATVTVPRSLAGTVITEYGVAELRGNSLRERAEALAEIAHPDHRQALRATTDRGDQL